jgi:hypothetical protein
MVRSSQVCNAGYTRHRQSSLKLELRTFQKVGTRELQSTGTALESSVKNFSIASRVNFLEKNFRLNLNVPRSSSSSSSNPKSLSQSLKRLNLHPNTYIQMQTVAILGTCSIVRNFLNYT